VSKRFTKTRPFGTLTILLWIKAWTSSRSIHWSVPALSGIFYGMGIDLTFMAMTNYLTDAYDIYSASALASSVFSRNIAAALLLPLATYPLYENLGIGWACSLLGFLCLALSPIPFVFIRCGPAMRSRSPFCERLKKQQEEGQELANIDSWVCSMPEKEILNICLEGLHDIEYNFCRIEVTRKAPS